MTALPQHEQNVTTATEVSTAFRAIAVAFVVMSCVLLCYGTIDIDAMMGDDLWNTLAFETGAFATTLGQALIDTGADKWRPVFSVAWFTAQKLLGPSFRSWVQLNLVLHALNSMLLAFIAYRVSRRWLVALACGGALALSRFAAYQVLQMTGLIEGVALFFFLLTLLSVIEASLRKSVAFTVLAIIFAAFTIHTHERYLAISPALALFALLAPLEQLTVRKRAVLVLGTMLPAAVNLGTKMFVFKLGIAVGTGGTKITLTAAVLTFFMNGLVNFFGWNEGPSYLSALSLDEAGPTGRAIGWGTTLTMAALIIVPGVLLVRRGVGRWKERLKGPASLAAVSVSAIAALLFAASVTIRLEYRWLVAPYCVLLISIAALWQSARLRMLLVIPLWALFCAACVREQLFYRYYIGNLFFMGGMRSATSAQNEIVDAYRGRPHNDAIVLATDDHAVCGWYFANGAFFARAWGKPSVKLTCVPTASFVANEGELAFRSRPDGTWLDCNPGSVSASLPECAHQPPALAK